MDYTKEWFREQWGLMGYQENFTRERGYDFLTEINAVLNRHQDRNAEVLELGCGSGYWTLKFLMPRFKNITAIDIIETPALLKDRAGIKYIQLPKNDYSCYSVPDESVDFLWSFGLFCHLSNSAVSEYLKNIYRVMRPGAKGLIMFANWPRNPTKAKIYPIENYRNDETYEGWFYSDLDTTIKQINESGLAFFEDTIPTFRDTLALFKRP